MTVTVVPEPSRRHSRRDGRWALLLVGPFLVGLAVFYLYPLVSTFVYSFTEWGFLGGYTWTGLDNYREVLASGEVRRSLLNTLIYTAISLTAVPISLFLAVLLNQDGLRFRGLYRVIFFLPVVTMPVAIGMVWRLLLGGDFGLVNVGLAAIGIDGPYWLADPRTALVVISLVGVWSVIGYDIVLFLGGLQTIPKELHEAAELDGAGAFQRFRHVTLPMVSPTMFFVVIISIINSLQMFDLVYIMIDRTNPALPSTQTIIYLFFKIGFVENDKGLASALVFFLFVLIVALTALQFRLQRRWVHYE